MKYYSEQLKKLFDSVEELKEAEEAHKEELAAEEAKKAERAERAKKVQDSFDIARDAYKAAQEELNKFVKDYGSFHCSYSTNTPTGVFGFMTDELDLLRHWF